MEIKQDSFGGYQPKGSAEINEVILIREIDTSEVYAEVEENHDDDPPFKGWIATVRNNDDGEEDFVTLGYDTKEDLIADLKGCGIRDIQYR